MKYGVYIGMLCLTKKATQFYLCVPFYVFFGVGWYSTKYLVAGLVGWINFPLARSLVSSEYLSMSFGGKI